MKAAQKREINVHLKLTEDESRDYKAEAEKLGWTVSQWIRRACNEKIAVQEARAGRKRGA